MFKKIVVLGFILSSAVSFSQREKVLNLPSFDKSLFHYGFYLGTNLNGYKISYKPSNVPNPGPNIEVEASIGFNVGLIADLRLHNNVNLRFEPGLMSNTKIVRFKHVSGTENQITREVGATFLHLPILLKLSTNRLNNIRPYVLGGLTYDYNFSSSESNSNDNFSGIFRTTSSNFMYELGVGVDIYFEYFKFSPSIRGIFAINNELVRDNDRPGGSNYTDPIDFLGTRGVFLHLSFQ